MQYVAESETKQHDASDTDGGVEESRASGVHNFVQVHAKAEGNDGGLQQKFGQALAFEVKRMHGRESVDEAAQEREGRRDQAGRGQDQGQKEYVLAHGSSVPVEKKRRPSSSSDRRLAELIGWI